MFSPAPTTAMPAASRCVQRFEEGLVAPVEAVVAGEGQDVEARARDARRRRPGCAITAWRACGSRVPRVAKLVSSWPNTSSASLSSRGVAAKQLSGSSRSGARSPVASTMPLSSASSPGAGSPAQLPGRAPQSRSSAWRPGSAMKRVPPGVRASGACATAAGASQRPVSSRRSSVASAATSSAGVNVQCPAPCTQSCASCCSRPGLARYAGAGCHALPAR